MDRRFRRIGKHGRRGGPGLGAGVAAARRRCCSPTPARGARRRSPTRSAAERLDSRRGHGRPCRPRRPRGQAAALDEVAPKIAGRAGGVISVLGATPLDDARAGAGADAGPADDAQPRRRGRARRDLPHAARRRGAQRRARRGAGAARLARQRLRGRRGAELDPATAVMGCAPAYIALAVEALIEAGDRGRARRGAQRQAGQRGDRRRRPAPADATSRARCRRRSPRPGGSTEAGLDALAERDVHAAFKAAVDASLERMAGRR